MDSRTDRLTALAQIGVRVTGMDLAEKFIGAHGS
jgi:hypothetical protein